MNYFVSTTGDDTTGDGLSPSSAWRTINKAVGASPAITLGGTGDTLFLAPGTYREGVTLGLSPTSTGGLSIVGDSKGTAFGVAPGAVDWRAWTDDYTVMSVPCLRAAGKSFVTVRDVKMIGGGIFNRGGCIDLQAGCSDWTIRDFVGVGYYGLGSVIVADATAGVPLNMVFARCRFRAYNNGIGCIVLNVPKHSADWDLNVKLTNLYFSGNSRGFSVAFSSGSGSYMGGGVAVQSCTFDAFSSNAAINVYGGQAAILPASPVTTYGCLFNGCGVTASATGQLIEDGNIFQAGSPRTNVNIGSNSITAACPAFDLGDGQLTGLPLRPWGEPTEGSPFLAFGNYGTVPADDLLGRPRPAIASAGCLERGPLPSDGGATTYIFQVEG